jgi:hypothetical protein
VKINQWPKAVMKVRAVAQVESQGSTVGTPRFCTNLQRWGTRHHYPCNCISPPQHVQRTRQDRGSHGTQCP